jgi:ketosteroid isomerase-like protein
VAAPPDTERLIAMIRAGEAFAPGTALEGLGGIEEMAALLGHIGHSDFVTVMVDKGGRATEHPGVEGLREALGDWITPYESFRLEIDETIVTDDDVIVFLVDQVATTKHGGVEIRTPSASVWRTLEGRIVQATFYIDQPMALKAAGIERP